MAGRKRGSMTRKILWGAVGYGVTTLSTLLTTYLTNLHISSLLGSILATTVGLVVVIIGVFIETAKDGAEENPPQNPPQNPPPGRSSPGGYYGSPPQLRRQPRSTAGTIGIVALVVGLCGGGGLGLAYGAQYLGHKAIDALNEQTIPPWEKKTQDPGRERITKAAVRTKGALTVSVSSVRTNQQATIVTITAKNTGKDSLELPVFGNALLDVPGANTLNADPAAGSFGGTVPAGGRATGTIVFDGVPGAGVTRMTLSFAHVFGLNGPGNIAVNVAVSGGS
jgi:hypothetical protein